MAFTSSRISAIIDADTRPFETGLNRARVLAQQFGQGVSQAGGQAATGLQGVSKAAVGLESGMRALGALAAVGGITQIATDAIRAGAELQKVEATVRALSGSQERYNEVVATARRSQSLYGGSLSDSLRGLGSLVNTSNRYGVELQKIDNITRRLAMVDPVQGVQGAAYALKEALSNQGATATLSLRNRFELDRSVLREIEDGSATAEEKVAALDNALNQLGITNEILTNSAATNAAALDRMSAAASNAGAAIGTGLLQVLRPVIDGLTGMFAAVENGINALTKVGESSANVGGQLLEASSGYDTFAARQTEVANQLAATGVIFPTLSEAAYNYAQSLVATGTAADEAYKKAVELAPVFVAISGAQRVLAEESQLSNTQISELGNQLGAYAAQSDGAAANARLLAQEYQKGSVSAPYFAAAIAALSQEQEMNAAAAAAAAEGTQQQAAAVQDAAGKEAMAAVETQILAAQKERLAAQASATADAIIAGGGSIEGQAARLAASSSLIDQLTAAYLRLAMAQGTAAGGPVRKTYGQQKDAREELRAGAGNQGPVNGGVQEYVRRQQESAKASMEARRAQAAQNLALADGAGKVAILRGELARLTPGTAEYISKQTALIQAERGVTAERAKGAKAAKARVSDEEKAADKLIDIQENAGRRLVELDKRIAAERAKAYRALAASILTSSADMVAAQEANDLEMAGMNREQLQAVAARERAEDEARSRQAAIVQEVRATAETDAELAQEQLDLKTKANEERARLDQEYYEKQRELAGNPEQLAVLETQYQEALAAQEQATAIRLELAAAQREQATAEAQAERDEVVAAARAQADDVSAASEDQKNAVVSAVAAQASAASNLASAWESAAGRVVAAAGRAAGAVTSIPSAGSGGPATTSGGQPQTSGSGTRAAGGGSFLTSGPTTITVGDNPGGVERVDVTPLSGRGITSVGPGMIKMAGGGSVLASSRATNPALNLPAEIQRAKSGLSSAYQDLAGEIARLEEWYLHKRKQARERTFFAEMELEVTQQQRRRWLNRQFEAQEAVIEKEERTREKELRQQAEESLKQAEHVDRVALDQRLADERAQKLAAAERRYNGRAIEIVSAGARAKSDVESFWRTVQLADTSAALQDERALIMDEYARRGEEERSRLEEQSATLSEEQEEAIRAQLDREFLTRRDALEDQQLRDKLIYDNYWGAHEEGTKKALENELKLLDEYWKSRYEQVPGGKDAWEALQKRATGGPALANNRYLVGENGPEILDMGATSGRIIPNNQIGGSGPSVMIAVDARGATNVQAVEEAGYRGAKRAMAEAGLRADKIRRGGGI